MHFSNLLFHRNDAAFSGAKVDLRAHEDCVAEFCCLQSSFLRLIILRHALIALFFHLLAWT